MAKNLVNKEKFKVILELYTNNKITFEEACTLFEDSVESIIWSYTPVEATSSFTTTNTQEDGKD